jgi:hypothetical protein
MPLLDENEHSSELFTKKTLEDTKIGDDEEPERWLETMGAEKSEIKRLQSSQVLLQDFINSVEFVNIFQNIFLE